MKRIIVILLGLFLLGGCIDESSLFVEFNEINISAESGSKTIRFLTNQNWIIEISGGGEAWCTVSPRSGNCGPDGTGETMVSWTTNLTPNERSCTLIITTTEGEAISKKTIQLKQSSGSN